MKLNFGMGIYTISDASEILRVPKSKIRYWFSRYVGGEFGKINNDGYFFDSSGAIAVNFFTLIETFVFYHLKSKGVSTKSIIEAHKILSNYHDTPYPFALKEFLCSGGELFHKIGDNIITLDAKRQYAIAQIILQFSENIDFRKEYASKYYPMGRNSAVVVNPQNQYGSPIIDGTNIKISTIISLYEGGEDSNFIAKLFDINDDQVIDAINFAA